MLLSETSHIPPTTSPARLAEDGPDGTTRAQPDEPVVVHAAGELDLDTVGAFRVEVADAVNSASPAPVIVDLRDVTFIDSTTLGVLVRAHNRLTAQGRHLTIRTQHPLLLRLFEVSGLTTFLQIED